MERKYSRIKPQKKSQTVTHTCASDSDAGGNSECDGDDEDLDDGDRDNGSIHFATI